MFDARFGKRGASTILISAMAVFVAGLSACGSSTNAPDSGGEKAADQTVVSQAEAAVKQVATGTEGAPPTSGPNAAVGKNVWVISCGQAVPGCSLQSNAAVEATKALGWKSTLFDGNFGANDGYSKGIRQAVAAKADGVIIVSIDCTAVTQALSEAKAAGVKVVSQNGFPCSDASLVTQYMPSSEAPDVGAFGRAEGKLQADWFIARSKGKAKILNYRFIDNNFAIEINKGFVDEIAKCETCSVVHQDVSLSDYSNPSLFQQKVSSALLANPTVTAVHVPFDSFITGGVGQAVVTSGRTGNLLVMGSEGFAANLNLIRTNRGQTAAMASDQVWIGWAAADAMNRAFAGEQPGPAGIGFKLIDVDTNLPPTDQDYRSSVDFRAAYKAAWGV